MIHICYGLYDRDGHYSKFVGTSMASVFENTQADVTVHILHDNTLTANNRDNFIYLAGHYGQEVKFYNVENIAKEKIAELQSRIPTIAESPFSIATMYRLIIPEFISIDKCIYLDADIVVNRDINDLWTIGINKHIIAAMPEMAAGNDNIEFYPCRKNMVKREDYFNAGVLLINLRELREQNINLMEEAMQFLEKHPQCTSYDQDFLNVFFNENYFKLPANFNHLVDYARKLVRPNKVSAEFYHFVHITLQYKFFY